MKAVHAGHEVTIALNKDRVVSAGNKPDFNSSFGKGTSHERHSRPPSSHAYKSQHRGGSIFISKEEYDRLHRKIKQQEMQIDELTTRFVNLTV
jgi:hypothetical protein